MAVGLVLASGCAAGGEDPIALPFEDDFSDCSAGWSTDRDDFVSLSCTGGAYRVLITNAERPQNSRILFGDGTSSLRVEADATRLAGPESVGTDEQLVYGVSCWSSQSEGYVFVVGPDGTWGIAKVTSGTRPFSFLVESQSAVDVVPVFGETNRIRGVCVGGGRRPTTLSLYVNERRVADTSDPVGGDSFPGLGFFVFSSADGADVRFDNFAAREATPAEVKDTEAPAEPVQAPVSGTTPTQAESGLCKARGVRYAGTTPEGAEVCFTLSDDETLLLETGFSFVAASGCPEGAAGTTHSTYPGEVDPSGRFEVPDALTATIRGETATGSFSDKDICPGKTFTFTARRRP